MPAHDRAPGLPVEDALSYLHAQSLGSMDDDLVGTFVRTAPHLIEFVEAHSEVRFDIATGFPDYKPELPGGKPTGGRSLSPAPYDAGRLGEWREKITTFPADWSNVGFDAEIRTRLHPSIGETPGPTCVAGTALVSELLKGLPLHGRSWRAHLHHRYSTR